jgi:AraC family transcriptional regulator
MTLRIGISGEVSAMVKDSKAQSHNSSAACHSVQSFVVVRCRYKDNEALPEHSHENPSISVLLRGSCPELSSLKTRQSPAGQVMFYPLGESHSARLFDKEGDVLNVEILPKLQEWLCTNDVATERPVSLRDPFCLEIGLRLEHEIGNPDALSELSVQALALELVCRVLRAGASERKRPTTWIKVVREILHDRFINPPSLTELAGVVQVHPVHLARAFRKRYGCSVGTYVCALRVEAALKALRDSDRSIAAIAIEMGFADQSHLCRATNKYAGMSPSRLRSVAVRIGAAGKSASV